MTGLELSKKIESWGYKRADLAALLGITEQHFNSKLKTKDVKVSFLYDLSAAINKSVFELLGEEGEGVSKTAVANPKAIGQSQIDWKDKYYALLEKHNLCLEEKEKLKEEYKN